MNARMYGPKVSLADLNARIAERVANCADSSPVPLETEAFFIGEHAKAPAPSRPMPFMFDVETTTPYFRWVLVAALLIGCFGPPLLKWATS